MASGTHPHHCIHSDSAMRLGSRKAMRMGRRAYSQRTAKRAALEVARLLRSHNETINVHIIHPNTYPKSLRRRGHKGTLGETGSTSVRSPTVTESGEELSEHCS